MPEDFPCFACGSTGPHRRSLPQRHPAMTDTEWERRMTSVPTLIHCGACQASIWEPDTGDGLTEPNLTMIPLACVIWRTRLWRSGIFPSS